jgi:hypothetical protein
MAILLNRTKICVFSKQTTENEHKESEKEEKKDRHKRRKEKRKESKHKRLLTLYFIL